MCLVTFAGLSQITSAIDFGVCADVRIDTRNERSGHLPNSPLVSFVVLDRSMYGVDGPADSKSSRKGYCTHSTRPPTSPDCYSPHLAQRVYCDSYDCPYGYDLVDDAKYVKCKWRKCTKEKCCEKGEPYLDQIDQCVWPVSSDICSTFFHCTVTSSLSYDLRSPANNRE